MFISLLVSRFPPPAPFAIDDSRNRIVEFRFGNFSTQRRKEARKAATTIWILEFVLLEFPDSRELVEWLLS